MDFVSQDVAEQTKQVTLIWTLGLPVGVISNRPCLSVCPSLFKYLSDRSLPFSEILHEVGNQ